MTLQERGRRAARQPAQLGDHRGRVGVRELARGQALRDTYKEAYRAPAGDEIGAATGIEFITAARRPRRRGHDHGGGTAGTTTAVPVTAAATRPRRPRGRARTRPRAAAARGGLTSSRSPSQAPRRRPRRSSDPVAEHGQQGAGVVDDGVRVRQLRRSRTGRSRPRPRAPRRPARRRCRAACRRSRPSARAATAGRRRGARAIAGSRPRSSSSEPKPPWPAAK